MTPGWEDRGFSARPDQALTQRFSYIDVREIEVETHMGFFLEEPKRKNLEYFLAEFVKRRKAGKLKNKSNYHVIWGFA